MAVKKGKTDLQLKDADSPKTSIFVNERRLLKIFGQSECKKDESDKYTCYYYCKSCVDSDVETEYKFYKPFEQSTNSTTKVDIFIKSLQIYFETHPDTCIIKKFLLQFIDYRLKQKNILSHEVGTFSFELIKQLDVYNLLVKIFQKHMCLNFFELDKKTKIQLICCDCEFKIYCQVPLNITENSHLPRHDCSTGKKDSTKKRSLSAIVNNNNGNSLNENVTKRQKRVLSEGLKGSEKKFFDDNNSSEFKDHIIENRGQENNVEAKKGETKEKLGISNKDFAGITDNVETKTAERNPSLKEKSLPKSKMLIAKGKKKLQRKNSKKQMSIVDILNRSKEHEGSNFLKSQSSTLDSNPISSINGRTLRTRANTNSNHVLEEHLVKPEKGDLVNQQISRLDPITNLDFNSSTVLKKTTAKNFVVGTHKLAEGSRSVSLNTPDTKPGSKQLNLFTRCCSAQPLFLEESLLTDNEVEDCEADAPEVEDLEFEEQSIKSDKLTIHSGSIINVDFELSDDSELESVPENLMKSPKDRKKPEYIPLSPVNLKHMNAVDEGHENFNRIISDIPVDFAKIKDFKNIKQKSTKKLPLLAKKLIEEPPEVKSIQEGIIESLKSPISLRNTRSPITIQSNSPKRNPIIDDNSDYDARNISLRNASIRSPRQINYNIITGGETAPLLKNKKLIEDQVTLYKKDDYEGILSLSPNNNETQNDIIAIESNLLLESEDSDSQKLDENKINAVDINHKLKIDESFLINQNIISEEAILDNIAVGHVKLQSEIKNNVTTNSHESYNIRESIVRHGLKEFENPQIYTAKAIANKVTDEIEKDKNTELVPVLSGMTNFKFSSGSKSKKILAKSTEVPAIKELSNYELVNNVATNEANSFDEIKVNRNKPVVTNISGNVTENSKKDEYVTSKQFKNEENNDKQELKGSDINNGNSIVIPEVVQNNLKQLDFEKTGVSMVGTPLKGPQSIDVDVKSIKINQFIDKLKALEISGSEPTTLSKQEKSSSKKTNKAFSIIADADKNSEILQSRAVHEPILKENISNVLQTHLPTKKHKLVKNVISIRNRTLFLQNISNAMDLSIVSPRIVMFQENLLDFKILLNNEKEEQERLINEECKKSKMNSIANYEKLRSKVESCNNLENLINLYKKLTQK